MNRHQEYYLKNQEELIRKAAARYSANREKVLERAKKHRSNKRKKINEVALHYGCQNPDCKWSGDYHPSMLEFHHYDPDQKQFQLGRGADYGWKSVAKEINKCVVLCACCHALFHAGEVTLTEAMLCNVGDRLEIINE